jgi:hypothetical protein
MNTDDSFTLIVEGKGKAPMRIVAGLKKALPDLVVVEHQRPCHTNAGKRLIHVERGVNNGNTDTG